MPKRPRESVAVESLPDVNKPHNAAAAAPDVEAMDQDLLRHVVGKELVKLVTAAHHCNNSYTDELKRTLQHHIIMLKDEESDNEGTHSVTNCS